MTVLTRLLARAKGQAASGLVPRLPGRFETAPGDRGGPLEVQEQRLSASPAPVGRSDRPMMNALPQPPSPPVGEGRFEPSRARPRPLIPGRAVADDETPASPLDAVPASQPGRGVPPISELPGPPPPGRTATPAATTAERVERLDRAARHAEEERALSAVLPEIAATPAPLLPDVRPPVDLPVRPDDPDRTQIPPFHAQPKTRTGRTAKEEPPDITIHIGRIDVVAVPEERKTPKRPERRRPQMTALGDYLRGKERGG